jgi:hypothetical protein
MDARSGIAGLALVALLCFGVTLPSSVQAYTVEYGLYLAATYSQWSAYNVGDHAVLFNSESFVGPLIDPQWDLVGIFTVDDSQLGRPFQLEMRWYWEPDLGNFSVTDDDGNPFSPVNGELLVFETPSDTVGGP